MIREENKKDLDWFYGGVEIRAEATSLLSDTSVSLIDVHALPIHAAELSIIELVDAVDDVLYYTALYRGEIISAQVVSEGPESPKAAALLLAQLSVLNKLRHAPFIRRILGAGYLIENDSSSEPKVMVLMESLADTVDTLGNYLQRELSWPDRLLFARDLASILHYLHQYHIVHEDLRVDDIFVGPEQQLVISEKVTSGLVIAPSHQIAEQNNVLSLGYMLLVLMIKPSIWLDQFHVNELVGSEVWCKHYLSELQSGRARSSLLIADCPERLEALLFWCCEANGRDRPTAIDCANELQTMLSYYMPDEMEHEEMGNGDPSVDYSFSDSLHVDETSRTSTPPPPPLYSSCEQDVNPMVAKIDDGADVEAEAARCQIISHSVDSDVDSLPPPPPPPFYAEQIEEPQVRSPSLPPVRRESLINLGLPPPIPNKTLSPISANGFQRPVQSFPKSPKSPSNIFITSEESEISSSDTELDASNEDVSDTLFSTLSSSFIGSELAVEQKIPFASSPEMSTDYFAPLSNERGIAEGLHQVQQIRLSIFEDALGAIFLTALPEDDCSSISASDHNNVADSGRKIVEELRPEDVSLLEQSGLIDLEGNSPEQKTSYGNEKGQEHLSYDNYQVAEVFSGNFLSPAQRASIKRILDDFDADKHHQRKYQLLYTQNAAGVKSGLLSHSKDSQSPATTPRMNGKERKTTPAQKSNESVTVKSILVGTKQRLFDLLVDLDKQIDRLEEGSPESLKNAKESLVQGLTSEILVSLKLIQTQISYINTGLLQRSPVMMDVELQAVQDALVQVGADTNMIFPCSVATSSSSPSSKKLEQLGVGEPTTGELEDKLSTDERNENVGFEMNSSPQNLMKEQLLHYSNEYIDQIADSHYSQLAAQHKDLFITSNMLDSAASRSPVMNSHNAIEENKQVVEDENAIDMSKKGEESKVDSEPSSLNVSRNVGSPLSSLLSFARLASRQNSTVIVDLKPDRVVLCDTTARFHREKQAIATNLAYGHIEEIFSMEIEASPTKPLYENSCPSHPEDKKPFLPEEMISNQISDHGGIEEEKQVEAAIVEHVGEIPSTTAEETSEIPLQIDSSFIANDPVASTSPLAIDERPTILEETSEIPLQKDPSFIANDPVASTSLPVVDERAIDERPTTSEETSEIPLQIDSSFIANDPVASTSPLAIDERPTILEETSEIPLQKDPSFIANDPVASTSLPVVDERPTTSEKTTSPISPALSHPSSSPRIDNTIKPSLKTFPARELIAINEDDDDNVAVGGAQPSTPSSLGLSSARSRVGWPSTPIRKPTGGLACADYFLTQIQQLDRAYSQAECVLARPVDESYDASPKLSSSPPDQPFFSGRRFDFKYQPTSLPDSKAQYAGLNKPVTSRRSPSPETERLSSALNSFLSVVSKCEETSKSANSLLENADQSIVSARSSPPSVIGSISANQSLAGSRPLSASTLSQSVVARGRTWNYSTELSSSNAPNKPFLSNLRSSNSSRNQSATWVERLANTHTQSSRRAFPRATVSSQWNQ